MVTGRDAFGALEPRRQIVLRQLAQRHRVEVAFDADAHDGHRVRVELEHGRRIRVLGHAAADAIDARPHLVRGFVEVGAPGKLQPHHARPFLRGRVDLLEAGDGRHRLLDGPRDQLLHFERPDSRIADAHRDAREFRLGHQVDRQARQRDGAQQDHHEADHEHRHGTMDGEARNTHM